MKSAPRPRFASHASTILTMIGISVGLGNIWRFPYMMGAHGGSAFLIVYLIFTVALAIPAMMAEWGLGRATGHGPFGAFREAFGARAGRIIASLLILTVLVAESYYLYVVANVAYGAGFAFFRGFGGDQLRGLEAGLSSAPQQYAIGLGLLFASYIVLRRGLNRGIAALSRYFVPFFVITITLLIGFSLSIPGARESAVEFLRPRFDLLDIDQVFAALGQSFFSLGLGGTFLLVFGSYIDHEENLLGAAVLTATGDVAAAVMAGLFIVPAVLALGLDMQQGPTLLFDTLPRLFALMPFGSTLGGLFLSALLMVTFLSSLAALEVLASGVRHISKDRWRPGRVAMVVCLLEAAMLLPISLRPDWIGTLDLVFGSGMQMFGSLLAILALTWGLGRTRALGAVFGSTEVPASGFYYMWLRGVLPAALGSVLVGFLLSKI